jgi:hypothetical protein
MADRNVDYQRVPQSPVSDGHVAVRLIPNPKELFFLNAKINQVKMKHGKFLLPLALSACLLTNLHAQTQAESKKGPASLAIELKNAHIWRGIDVTHNFLIDGDVRVSDKTNTFAVGLWGATTLTKDFREFNYYTGFYKGGFSLEIWDIFNFSEKNQYGVTNPGGYNTEKAFDYSAHKTGHFVDLRLGYTFPEKFPLYLGWSSIVFGRDRAWLPGNNPDDYKDRRYSNSRYSTYVEASYPILKSNIADLTAGIGGAFKFCKAKIDGQVIEGNFYGKSDGIITCTLAASRNFRFSDDYSLPVTLSWVWNFQTSKTYMQVAMQVIQF